WLQRHCSEEWEVISGEGKERKTTADKREFTLIATADTLAAEGDARADVRQRGLFRVNSYAAELKLDARWASLAGLQPQREHAGSRLLCGPARLVLTLSDVRGVRAAQVLIDGQPQTVQAGTHHAKYASGLHAELPAARLADTDTDTAPLRAQLKLDLAGTGQLALVPAAGATDWRLKSDWPHPSFGGRFLPSQHSVTSQGFDAQWKVSSLATAAPAELSRGAALCTPTQRTEPDGTTVSPPTPACLDTLSVAFFDPVNPYVLSDRAIKYGLLFVVLTFVAVALIEVLSARRVHPVQYLLVGLALSLFFLLLLSLSEHVAFAQAYAAAAGACALLLGYYAAHMLGHGLGGAAFGAAIALLYGLLYLLLQMEQNALAVGSVVLFAALAAVMVLTRRIDWYALFDSWRGGNTAGPVRRAAAETSA
ncbi:cell envelope integrity protein CreD, partial [Aquabacterium sp.]|uniref:cell envelope integrity protein CreD n=1 Tax=Aquabacterium sp. TaxID=1872578 RepID=UPI002D02132D